MMKKILGLITIMVIALTLITAPVNGESKSNKQIALDYCNTYCVNYPVQVVEYNQVPEDRQDDGVVYVERIKTTSKGKYGKTKDGCVVRYNKHIKKGKKETVYLIYNPTTNSCDDVICFVSNHKFKGDKVKLYRPVDCCNCDGTSNDCVYYIHNLERHMTEQEIYEFEQMEMDR